MGYPGGAGGGWEERGGGLKIKSVKKGVELSKVETEHGPQPAGNLGGWGRPSDRKEKAQTRRGQKGTFQRIFFERGWIYPGAPCGDLGEG